MTVLVLKRNFKFGFKNISPPLKLAYFNYYERDICIFRIFIPFGHLFYSKNHESPI